MNDIDNMLRAARPVPRRELPVDFAARIVTELNAQPTPLKRSWLQEKLFMKHIPRMAIAVLALLLIVAVGGTSYALINNISLHDIMNMQFRKYSTDAQMQKFYTDYVDARKRGDSNALATFGTHATKELKSKLDAAPKGVDPILCSQNLPDTVIFTVDSDNLSVKAIGRYGNNTVTVPVVYDKPSGLYLDITCTPSQVATGAALMQKYYQDYVTAAAEGNATAGMAEFKKHASPALVATLNQEYGFDRVLCAQNTPAMVTFSDLGPRSMTANLTFVSGVTNVTLAFDPGTQQFTGITCRAPQQ